MYCQKCGKEVSENSQFCSACGQPVNNSYSKQTVYQSPDHLLQELSSKINTYVIIWIVIACLQVVIGLLNVGIGFALNADYEDGTTNIITGIFILIVAVINFVNASRDSKYRQEILINPVGIYNKFSPIGSYIANMIYNVLFGGIIGVVGSIYGLSIRNFVISHKAEFDNIESHHIEKLNNNQASNTQNA